MKTHTETTHEILVKVVAVRQTYTNNRGDKVVSLSIKDEDRSSQLFGKLLYCVGPDQDGEPGVLNCYNAVADFAQREISENCIIHVQDPKELCCHAGGPNTSPSVFCFAGLLK